MIPAVSSHSSIFSPPLHPTTPNGAAVLHSYWHHNKRGWVPFWLRAVGVPSPKFPGYLPPLLAGAVRCPLPSLGHEKGLCVPQEWDVSIAEHFPAQPCTVCSHPFPRGATRKKTFPGRGTVPRQQLSLDLIGFFFHIFVLLPLRT